jgi:NTE family protein
LPLGSEGLDEDGIALCLSGGGFRASLFHVGMLWRLRDLGVLPKLTRISSVSGGSIAAAVLALAWKDLAADGFSSDAFRARFVEPLRGFCARTIDAPAIAAGVLLPWRSAADGLAAAYAEHLVGASTLQDLPDQPNFIFCATNLQTGRLFRLAKPYIADYRIGLIRNAALPIATAVAASSGFPPFFSPVEFAAPGPFEAGPGTTLHDDPAYTQHLSLCDGGAYDNLGLQTAWPRCRTVLVSDAGAPFDQVREVRSDWVRLTLRALDIATDQARGLRKQSLVASYKAGERKGAYWGIGTDIAGYSAVPLMRCHVDITGPLAALRTRLDRFSTEEQERLINWGYALCDAAIRRWAPGLSPGATVGTAWPCPDHPLAPDA